MKDSKLIPVILCGGSGKRLWPLSRKSFPKQFLNLNKDNKHSLLQQTYQRLINLKNLSNPIFIANEEHRFIVAEQMREIDINPETIILEPIGKNTAPAIALAALKALEVNDDPIMIVLASDHLIKDNNSFLDSLKSSIKYAESGKLVTFGVLPTYPETGYGYIESEMELNIKTLEATKIKKFIEKPDIGKAEKFFKDRKYSWNSGMFVFKAKSILNEIEEHAPEIIKYCKIFIKNSEKDLDFLRIYEKDFVNCPSLSIDVAVMEKTKLGLVVPLNAKWSDIGNWKSLWEYEEKNLDGNILKGKVVVKDVKNSFFSSDSRLLVGIGLEELIAIETNDAILIASKNSVQNVKILVEEMIKNDLIEATQHKKVHRPWGYYFTIACTDKWQVKLIEVSPNASLSLQSHRHRSEHWIVVKGKALVEIDKYKKLLNQNESAYIPVGSKHRLSNPHKDILVLIEVQSGTYLGEDDIKRFEDKYGR